MINEKARSKIDLFLILSFLGVALLIQYSSDFSETQRRLFFVLIISYFWVSSLILYAKIQLDLHMFEPFSIISLLYLCVFIIKPIVDLTTNSMVEHGVNVINGGVKATCLFTAGYTVFCFSYYISRAEFVSRLFLVQTGEDEKISSSQWNISLLYIIWAAAFSLSLLGMISSGLSLRYIFSFGREGEFTVDESKTALLFLTNFGITTITLWLMILEYSRNKAAKIFITVVTLIYIIMRNSRWLMLVFILAPLTLNYLKKKREPRLLNITVIALIALAIFAWMQANRYSLRTGGAIQGWGKDGLTLAVMFAPMGTDFSTYRLFYSMVERFPESYNFMYGTTFLYMFVLFIPRRIWPGKPENPVRDMIEHSLNRYARVSGTAVANIGEFYANFGVLGVIIGMYLFGYGAKCLRNLVYGDREHAYKPVEKDAMILYSIMFPLLFQWTARGNFSGNFYMTVFACLPFIIKKALL